MDDASQRGIAGRGGHGVFEFAGLVDRAGVQRISHGLVDRHALARDRRLIQRGLAAQHAAIDRHALAGTQPHHGAHGHVARRHGQPGAVRLLHGGLLGRHRHQPPHGVARAVQRGGLDALRQGEQHHHHRRLGPLADQHGAGDGDAHQGVDIEIAVADGDPALAIDAQTGHQHSGQRQHGGCVRQAPFEPVCRLGAQCGHAGQCQWPPGLGRFGGSGGVGRGVGIQRLGVHAERGNRLDHDVGRIQRVVDGQHALHQVEVERGHAGHAAELVADQRFLGRAVHGLDAVGG
ncbi:hypothetical protein D3C81_1216470 [compost metagenome]